MFKVGIGKDNHAFQEGIPLKLGGIEIHNEYGLKGNSDGDAVLHSICDALSSAVGKGSIGTYADKMCLDHDIKDSREYVEVALGFVKDAGYKVNNISITIEAKKPRLEKHFDKMKESIASMLEVGRDEVGITANTGDGLTSFAEGEGIQVITIVSLISSQNED